MKKLTLLAITSLLFVATANAQNKGGVAVLDIDAVARELGVEASVKAALQAMGTNLNMELNKTKASFEAQLRNEQTQAGDNPDEKTKVKMIQLKNQLNTEFARLKQQAQRTLAQERVTRITQFREKLKPIAMAAAKAKGLSIVLMKVTPPVYGYTADVDITKDTIARAVKAGLKEKTPAKPAAAPAKPAATPKKPK